MVDIWLIFSILLIFSVLLIFNILLIFGFSKTIWLIFGWYLVSKLLIFPGSSNDSGSHWQVSWRSSGTSFRVGCAEWMGREICHLPQGFNGEDEPWKRMRNRRRNSEKSNCHLKSTEIQSFMWFTIVVSYFCFKWRNGYSRYGWIQTIDNSDMDWHGLVVNHMVGTQYTFHR